MVLPLDRTELSQIRTYILNRIEDGELVPDQNTIEFDVVQKYGDRFKFDVDTVPPEVKNLIQDLLFEDQRYSLVIKELGVTE